MRRASWYALMIVAAVGWGIAGLLAHALVSRVGWFGVLIIGLIIILVPQLAELNRPLMAQWSIGLRGGWSVLSATNGSTSLGPLASLPC